MTTFIIDEQNNITAFGSPEAATATTTPFDAFNSQLQLAELVAGWPTARLVTLWNSLPGVTPVKRFKNSDTAASRIWDRMQGLGEAAQPQEQRKAKGGTRSARGTPAMSQSAQKASPAKRRPKPRNSPKRRKPPRRARAAECASDRPAAAQERRHSGGNYAEDGLAGSHRAGPMAGSLKKAGYQIASFKSDKGGQTYKIG